MIRTSMRKPPLLDNLDAWVSTGIVLEASRIAGAKGLTLANSTTYYVPITAALFEVLGRDPRSFSVHMKWAAAVVATITIEVSDFPNEDIDTASLYDVSPYDAAAGNWQQWNPPAAYVPVTGSGNSATAATVTAGGSAAGSAVFEMTDVASRRLRLKLAVTTGGLARVAADAKDVW